jgi:ATP dependent DNA ligase domain
LRARRRGGHLRPAAPVPLDWLREPAAVATPPLLMAFDLLYHERRDLTARPLRERRARLEDVVTNNDLVFPIRRLAPDGLEAWAQVVERGYEGLVAKDEASAYQGAWTRRWLKVKQKDWTVAEDGWRLRMSTLSGLGPQDRRRSKGIRMLVLRRSPLTRQIVSGAFRYVNRLRPFAPNATVMQADFSPRVRRESRSVLEASNEKSSGSAPLRGTAQKD